MLEGDTPVAASGGRATVSKPGGALVSEVVRILAFGTAVVATGEDTASRLDAVDGVFTFDEDVALDAPAAVTLALDGVFIKVGKGGCVVVLVPDAVAARGEFEEVSCAGKSWLTSFCFFCFFEARFGFKREPVGDRPLFFFALFPSLEPTSISMSATAVSTLTVTGQGQRPLFF